MTKDEFVDEISKLPGVDKKKAEALYDAGFTTKAKLEEASQADLEAVEGIGPKVAEAIIAGLGEEKAAPSEIQVVEDKGKGAKKTEIVEAERVYRVRIKAEIPDELAAALRIRAQRAANEPAFRRYHWWYKRLDDNWRKSHGELSKQRRGFSYRPPRVKVGYGKPAVTRGLHPSGFEEVLVHNVNDIAGLDPKTQAIRIGGTVGKRKRRDIVAKADEFKLRVLNPGVI